MTVMVIRIVLATLLLSATRAYGQDSHAEQVNRLIEGVHRRVSDAAIAADSLLNAAQHRSEAERLAAAGEHKQARTELQLAADVIARPDPAIQSDPLLQEYAATLRQAITNIEVAEQSAQTIPVRASESASDWQVIQRILTTNSLPAELAAVVTVESAGNPNALSPKGARGLWQLMPDTARRYGLRVDSRVDERVDPIKSTYAAIRYLRDLYDMFHDWPLALAAYNAGENRVQDVIERTGIRRLTEMAQKGMLPIETIRYVPAVLTAMSTMR
jgi:soluble lytic murein transglycosylase-like protein